MKVNNIQFCFKRNLNKFSLHCTNTSTNYTMLCSNVTLIVLIMASNIGRVPAHNNLTQV